MESSSANPAPERAAPTTNPPPPPPAATNTAPAVPPWQQVWSAPAQWVVCVLLAAAVLVLALRGLVDRPPSHHPHQANWAYRLDLNQASAAELMQIPGIGPQLAGRIEEHQQSRGFHHIDDLRLVPGIGPATLERLRPWVYVSNPAHPISSPISSPKPLAKAPKKSKKAEALTGPPIDVNSASAGELQKLPGIGPKMSQRIIDERAKKPFATVEELRRVSGIGPKTLEKLRPFVTVGGDKPPLLTSQGAITSGYNEKE